MNNYRQTFLIAIIFQIPMLPYCFWVKETLYYLQDSLDFRETLKNLVYIHNYNGMNNIAELKQLMLINLDPKQILACTKKISFKKRGQSLIKNLFSSIDLTFFKNLLMIFFMSTHLEGLEQFLPITLQYLGIKDINLNGTLIAVSEFIACLVIIQFC